MSNSSTHFIWQEQIIIEKEKEKENKAKKETSLMTRIINVVYNYRERQLN